MAISMIDYILYFVNMRSFTKPNQCHRNRGMVFLRLSSVHARCLGSRHRGVHLWELGYVLCPYIPGKLCVVQLLKSLVLNLARDNRDNAFPTSFVYVFDII
jgi:hypothetical protein